MRSTATKSTSDLNFSGLASCSGRTSRKSRTMPAAAGTATTLRMSRVRRAGKTFTSTSVIGAADHRRDHEEGNKHGHGEEPEHPAAAVHPAVRREHRDRHQRDHPARGDHGLDQLRAVQPQPVHRSRHQQVEVLRQEETRERRDDVRQQQDREEAHEHQPEQFAGEQRPDFRNAAEIHEQLVQQAEDECPEQRPDHRQQRDPHAAAFLVAHRSRPRREHLGHEQVQQRRVGSCPATRTPAAGVIDGRRPLGIEHFDEIPRRVLAGEPQEDLLEPALLRACAQFVHRAARDDLSRPR